MSGVAMVAIQSRADGSLVLGRYIGGERAGELAELDTGEMHHLVVAEIIEGFRDGTLVAQEGDD